MAADTNEVQVDLNDPRLQTGLGVVLTVGAMGILSLNGSALGLQQWARWFAATFLFFFGMAFTMRAMTHLA